MAQTITDEIRTHEAEMAEIEARIMAILDNARNHFVALGALGETV